MANKSIRAKLTELKRKFPFRTTSGFLHTSKADLKRRFTTIFVVALIFDEERGHSIFIWNPHRKEMQWDYNGWNRWLNLKGLDILSNAVMDAINSKRGSEWEMRRIIGFHGGDYKTNLHVVQERERAIYSSKTGAKRSKRNKTNVKR